MNAYHQELLNICDDIPECFHSAFHFGSSLWSARPDDVDLLVVYDDCQDISDVIMQRRKLLDMLVVMFEGVIVDLVSLSDEELRLSGFLQKTKCMPIRDGRSHDSYH